MNFACNATKSFKSSSLSKPNAVGQVLGNPEFAILKTGCNFCQQHIAIRVSIIDGIAERASRIEEIYEQKLVRLSALRQSILQKAFTGDLTSPPSTAIKEAAE